jgi:hypothetical protein
MKVPQRYKDWAPQMMHALIRDFGLTDFQAAGIVGNGGHESAGFVKMQELRPTIPGSRGGYGAFQWTGPRRVLFEAWLKRNSWTVHDYIGNYSFLFRELVGPEKAAIEAVKKTSTLAEATETFCRVFERPGVIHMDSRLRWADEALHLYAEWTPPVEVIEPEPEPEPEPVPVPAEPTIEEKLQEMERLMTTFLDALGDSRELDNAKMNVSQARMWALEHLRRSRAEAL